MIVEQPEPISIDSNDKIHANIEEEVIPKLGLSLRLRKMHMISIIVMRV